MDGPGGAQTARRTFIVTGATDGIGQNTALCLAMNAPAVDSEEQKRVIGVHGRNQDKLQNTLNMIA